MGATVGRCKVDSMSLSGCAWVERISLQEHLFHSSGPWMVSALMLIFHFTDCSEIFCDGWDLQARVCVCVCVCVCVGCDKLKTMEMLERQQLPSLITEPYCCFVVTSWCFKCLCVSVMEDIEQMFGVVVLVAPDVHHSLTSRVGLQLKLN